MTEEEIIELVDQVADLLEDLITPDQNEILRRVRNELDVREDS